MQRRRNYGRGYRRYARRAAPPQWERHNVLGQTSVANGSQAAVTLYSATKPVKMTNMCLQISTVTTTALLSDAFFAIVLVPDGYTANTLNITTAQDIYEPTQFILCTGMLSSINMNMIQVPIARRLKAGDDIVIVIANTSSSGTFDYNYMWSYTEIE